MAVTIRTIITSNLDPARTRINLVLDPSRIVLESDLATRIPLVEIRRTLIQEVMIVTPTPHSTTTTYNTPISTPNTTLVIIITGLPASPYPSQEIELLSAGMIMKHRYNQRENVGQFKTLLKI